jgi:hypothetical protein
MSTVPTKRVLRNFGMGLMAYIIGDLFPLRKNDESERDTVEKLAQMTLADKLYIRPTWRQMQTKRGSLTPFVYWDLALEMAEKYNKPLAFRIMLNNPDVEENPIPDFILEKCPQFSLGKRKNPPNSKAAAETRWRRENFVPEYHNPCFLEALEEFDGLLAEKYNGHPLIEFVDTFMYGFWGEGHTWPLLDTNPFPDQCTAMETWLRIFDFQRRHWNQTPLVTNLQSDDNHVGNGVLVDATLRSGEWIRMDSIFTENQLIEAFGNRPPHIAAICENGFSNGSPDSLKIIDNEPMSERLFAHAIDMGANYYSLWNWHDIHADHIMRYYKQYPDGLEKLRQIIGYRIRPAIIWEYQHDGRQALIIGITNNGIAGVPGMVRLVLIDKQGKPIASGTLDPGYPLPHKIRQARLILPQGALWDGGTLRGELLVKGKAHPIDWDLEESLLKNGDLILRRNPYL